MKDVKRVGIDLAKKIFHVAAARRCAGYAVAVGEKVADGFAREGQQRVRGVGPANSAVDSGSRRVECAASQRGVAAAHGRRSLRVSGKRRWWWGSGWPPRARRAPSGTRPSWERRRNGSPCLRRWRTASTARSRSNSRGRRAVSTTGDTQGECGFRVFKFEAVDGPSDARLRWP